MIILALLFMGFLMFFALKTNKKRRINNNSLKPMRFNLDTRRSPWTRGRGGF